MATEKILMFNQKFPNLESFTNHEHDLINVVYKDHDHVNKDDTLSFDGNDVEEISPDRKLDKKDRAKDGRYDRIGDGLGESC